MNSNVNILITKGEFWNSAMTNHSPQMPKQSFPKLMDIISIASQFSFYKINPHFCPNARNYCTNNPSVPFIEFLAGV